MIKKHFIFLLSFIMIFQLFAPAAINVNAETINDSFENESKDGKTKEDIFPERMEERQELKSKKTVNTNTYLNSDGTFSTEVYQEAVQYEDKNKKWKEIKKEIKKSSKKDYSYENTTNLFKSYFDENAKIEISDDKYKLSFLLKETEKLKPDLKDNYLIYRNIFKQTDLKYTVNSGSIKEELYLKNKNAPTSFTYELKTENLITKINEDNSISFLSEDKEIYKMEKFFAYDNKENYAPEIKPEITKTETGYEIKITLDNNWFNDKERKFPIIIDPTITGNNTYQDTFVYSAEPNSEFSYWSYNRVGNNGYGKSRTYSFINLPTLPTGSVVQSASYEVYQTLSQNSDTIVDLHEVTSIWDFSALSWNEQPTFNQTPESSLTFETVGTKGFDITELAKSWYSGEKMYYGFLLKARDENSSKREFISSRSLEEEKKPKLIINYKIDGLGIEDYWSYDNGINLTNGNFVYSETDAYLSGRGFNINISRVFNSQSNDKLNIGQKWQLNTDMRMKFAEGHFDFGNMVFIDSDGSETVLIGSRSEEWFSDESFEKSVFYSELNPFFTNILMYDKDSNEYAFNPETGKIVYIKDTNGNKITYDYNSDKNLKQVTDSTGRKVNFVYDENKNLIEINGNEITKVKYIYDGDNLTKVEKVSTDGVILTSSEYEYDNENNIIKVIDGNGNSTEINYTDGKVTSFVEKVTENGEVKTLTTSYDYSNQTYDTVITTKTAPNGIKTRFHTNDAGNIIKIENGYNVSTGTSETTEEYEWNENNLISSVKDGRSNITSYSYNSDRDVEQITNSDLTKELFKYEGYNLSQYTSTSGITTKENYDSNKNNVTSIDSNGNTTTNEIDKNGNLISSYSELSTSENIVLNSGFEKWTNGLPNSWFLFGTTTKSDILNSTGRPNGKSSLRLKSSSDTVKSEMVSEYLPVDPDSTYNLSWYDHQISNGKSEVKIRWYDSSKTYIKQETVGNKIGDQQVWVRRNGNIISPTNAEYIRIILSTSNSTTYFDNIQLEKGNYVNGINILSNESFDIDNDKNNLPDGWTTNNVNKVTLDSGNDYNGDSNGNSVKITADNGNKNFINQYFELSGKKGTEIEFSGYSKAKGVDLGSGDYVLRMRVQNQDGTNDYYSIDYTKGTHDWEFKSKSIVLKKDYKKFNIYAQLGQKTGEVWFDDININLTYSDNAQISKYNLVENGGFELTDSSGNASGFIKYMYNTAKVDLVSYENDEEVFTGNNAYKITKADKSLNTIIHDHLEPIRTGKNYTFSAMAKTKDVTAGGATVLLQLRDENDILVAEKYSTQSIDGDTDWTRIYVNISETEAKKLNSNSFYLRGLLRTKNGTTGTVYFDDVRFEEGNPTTKYTYDSKGNYLTSETNEIGKKISYTNDLKGNVTKVVYDDTTYTDEFTYDELGRLVKTKDNRNLIIENIYDKVGNTKEVKYKNSIDGSIIGTLKNEYNELNEVTSFYDQNNFVTTFERDINRNVTKTILPNGKQILYDYDNLDQIKDISFIGDNNKYSFEYDKNGNITKETKNNNETTTYTLDKNIDQVNKITYPNGKNITINYDDEGNVVSYKNSVLSNPTTFEYSSTGSHEKTITPFGITTVRNYDEKGLVKSISKVSGSNKTKTYYEYNDLGQLIKKWSESTEGTKLNNDENFIYDKDGNVTQISYSGGSKKQYTYDANGRILSEKHLNSSSSVIYEYKYTYDVLGNRLTFNNGTTTKNYQYDSANQLISNGNISYTYDEVGNLLTDENYIYEYTALSQVKTVKDKQGNLIASYEYDSNGLRTKKTTQNETEKYVYFNNDLEYITNENNVLKYSFDRDNDGTYLGFIDHTTSTPTVYNYVLNYRGDVIAIKNSSGTTIVEYTYDDFGNLLSSTGIKTLGNGKLLKDENPIRYASYYFDKETKLYYLKARYYNSELGRFTTRDPIVNENLYVYAENNPIIYTDSNGDFIQVVIGAIQLGVSAYEVYKSVKKGSSGGIAKAAFDATPIGKAKKLIKSGKKGFKLLKQYNYDGITKINKKYAGTVFKFKDKDKHLLKKYPKGVKYNIYGFPDFSPYSIATVKVNDLIGDYYYDYIKAYAKAGINKNNIPKGYTWHHHEDGKTMMLVPTDLHSATKHTGGAAWLRKNKK